MVSAHPLSTQLRSRQLGLEYAYDWSNGGMSDEQLIFLVVCRGRFNDLLKIAGHYGLDNIIAAAEKIPPDQYPPRLDDMIMNIREGMGNA